MLTVIAALTITLLAACASPTVPSHPPAAQTVAPINTPVAATKVPTTALIAAPNATRRPVLQPFNEVIFYNQDAMTCVGKTVAIPAPSGNEEVPTFDIGQMGWQDSSAIVALYLAKDPPKDMFYAAEWYKYGTNKPFIIQVIEAKVVGLEQATHYCLQVYVVNPSPKDIGGGLVKVTYIPMSKPAVVGFATLKKQ